MNDTSSNPDKLLRDIAPGDEQQVEDIARRVRGYLIGFALATALTVVSFFMAGTTLVWTPSIPVALSVLAVAQIGVHIVFFLHMTSGPDNVNNLMALAFGLLIVLLVVLGSIWIIHHLNHNMMPMEQLLKMQR